MTIPANDIAYNPADSTLAVAHRDGTIRLWDGREQQTLLDYQTRPVESVALNADGSLLAMVSGTEIRLWDTAARETTGLFTDFVGQVWYLQFGAGGELYFKVLNQASNTHYIWYPDDDEPILTADGFPPDPANDALVAVAQSFFPRGRQHQVRTQVVQVPNSSILTISDGITLQFWDKDSRLPLFSTRFLLDMPGYPIGFVGFSADGTTMFTLHNGYITLWGRI